MKVSTALRQTVFLFVTIILVSCSGESQDKKKTDNTATEKTVEQQVNIPTDWQTYTSDEFDFSFRYPPKARVDISDPGVENQPKRVRIRLLGPNNVEGSEITDGFTLYVRSVDTSGQQTVANVAQQVFNSAAEQQEVVDSLSQRNGSSSTSGYRFRMRSKLGGEVDYMIFQGDGQQIYVTMSLVSIPKDLERDYQAIISNIRQTLKAAASTSESDTLRTTIE